MVSQASTRVVDPILGGLIVGALQKKSDFVARQALRVIPVGGKGATGQILLEQPAAFMGDPGVNMKRAPGAPMAVLNQDNPRDPVTYACTPRSGKVSRIPKEHIRRNQFGSANYAATGELTAQEMEYLQRRGAAVCSRALTVEEERDFNTLMLESGWTSSTVALLTGGAGVQWNANGGKPLNDLHILKVQCRDAANGVDPDSLIIPVAVADALCRNPEVRNIFVIATGNGSAAASGAQHVVTHTALKSILSSVLEIPYVHIAKGRRRTSQHGQTIATASIYTDTIWMGCLFGGQENEPLVNGNDVTMEAVAAVMLVEQDVESGIEWDNDHQSYQPWVDESYDMKVLDASLGQQLTDCLAA